MRTRRSPATTAWWCCPHAAVSPKDKALVEQTVRLMYQRVYAKLRDRTFYSIDELNAAIRPLVDAHNATRFQRLPYSRREAV